MLTIIERCQDIWDRIRHSRTQIFTKLNIPHDHVIGETQVGSVFKANKHYFQIRVNEMFLAYDRQWWSTYAPMVFTTTEFTYDKSEEAVPFVVGTSLLDKYGQETPANMVFSDTRVAGLHPYRGGPLRLSLILYQMRREDYAHGLLQMVESITNVLNVSLPLSNYVKVASVALDGVESLLGMKDTMPLLGVRREFDPDAGDTLESGYFVLFDKPDTELASERGMFWVKDHQLCYGKNISEARPYRDASFVLYSILQTEERGDIRLLPFYPLYEQILKSANEPYDSDWERTKVSMTALAGAMYTSPDLTMTQAEKLEAEYTDEMTRIHKKAQGRAMLGPSKKQSALDQKLEETLKILAL